MISHSAITGMGRSYAIRRLIVCSLVLIPLSVENLHSQGDRPRITRFSLASGSFNTGQRTVYARLTTEGPTPTHFRMSEKPDFSGALWRAFEPISQFTLSSELGFKKVYAQVGIAASVSVPGTAVTTTTLAKSPSVGFTMASVSDAAMDEIVYGLPDLRIAVSMPAQVRDGRFRSFEFDVTISNAGQATPPGHVINVYNSFVLNSLPIERVEVNFGLANLVGDGCKVTDTPTLECTLAPMPPNHAVTLHIRAATNNVLREGQNEVTHTLRTRIYGISEGNSANNWKDTPLKIVR